MRSSSRRRSPLGEGCLGAELTEGRPAPVHAGGAGHAVVVPGLPAMGALPHHRRLLDGGAVRDELGDLPVDPGGVGGGSEGGAGVRGERVGAVRVVSSPI